MREDTALKENPCKQLNNLVANFDSPVLVVAGPGTGKTTAIACRLKFLIEKPTTSSSRILAITFTNEAADEMKRKLEKLGVKQIPENIRTLHSFAMRVLRLNSLKVGVPSGFVVANSDESELVAKDVFSDLKNKGYQMLPRSDKKFMRAFQEKVSCGLPGSATFRNGVEIADPNFSRFEQRYIELSRFYNAVDWFEVVPLTNSLLNNDDIKNQVQQWFDHIVVDEYQDLNPAEQTFVSLIRDPNATLFVVGDDDQSIYESGRFADPLGIKHFRQKYSNAIIDKTTLTTSHRCPETILKAAVSLIEHNNPNRIPKQLHTVRKDGIVYKEGGFGSK
ncbi:MAG: hypothetical protein COX49_01935 [bacterium (Candidatus Stahlbacteria) CG23_combo_of_CG06-09_8_20_14_all_40_9]|nr:MAG: hypothetical protein COX49_01935 [bacterium (Candidatus Stahlbacteria) CG23_combo_of_CG06-09_8_20_14_all_40_9]